MKMVLHCQLTFILFIIFSFNLETKQKQVAVNNGEDDFEWMKMKWDSILVDPNSDPSNTVSVDDSHEAEDLLISDFSNKHFKSNSNLGDNELNTFPEDEVFIESNDSSKSTGSMNSVESVNKVKDDAEDSDSKNERNSDIMESQDTEHDEVNESEDSGNERVQSESSLKLENSETAFAGSEEISEKDLPEESDSPRERNSDINENQDVEHDKVDEDEDLEDETTAPESSLKLENSETAFAGSEEVSEKDLPEESDSPRERNSHINENQDVGHDEVDEDEDSEDETTAPESSLKLENSEAAFAGSEEVSEKDLPEESDSPRERNSDINENQDVEHDEVDEDSEDETTAPESSLNLENSQTALEGTGEISNAEQPNSEFLSQRSFIFNPMAGAQEQFQNCTTPTNESGTCRYLQHCLIPTVVASLNQFMDYVCIIEGRFIGVCCPHNPVDTVVVQDQNETAKNDSELNENCGVATNTRIVGGMNADPKAYPWMVALLSKSRKFFCGGALINDRYVLTAAHCTFDIPKNEIIARVGEYDFKDDGETHEEYAVVEMKRHGHYSRRTLANDIALLKLEKSVKFSQFVKTICFPEEENDYVGENATLTGWGNTKGGGATSDVLQQATFPIISNDECSERHGLPIPEFLICSASLGKDQGGCNGDSGGPLMLLDKNDRWKIIGLVSWGRRGCSPEFPTVYTRVSYYLDWIEEHAK